MFDTIVISQRKILSSNLSCFKTFDIFLYIYITQCATSIKAKCHLNPWSQNACEKTSLRKFWGLARWIMHHELASENNNLFRIPVRGTVRGGVKHQENILLMWWLQCRQTFFFYRFVGSQGSGNNLSGWLNLFLIIKTNNISQTGTDIKVQSSERIPSISSPFNPTLLICTAYYTFKKYHIYYSLPDISRLSF